jgi:hemoglobin
MKDIETREDIIRLVDQFYDRVQVSDTIGKIFAHVDWAHHKPIMYSFWSTMILGEQSYQRNPFEKHVPLNLAPEHFAEWLRLFQLTVDELFKGSNATQVKERAWSIANVWQYKLSQQGR